MRHSVLAVPVATNKNNNELPMSIDKQTDPIQPDKPSCQTLIDQRVGELATLLQSRRLVISTAESCTGGLIAAAITDMPGSSEWFERGFVTYSNDAKGQLLGVSSQVFEEHGAVSEECVKAMAEGALQRAGADVAVAVSGIAGPGGATPGKPVGTVWIGWALQHSGTHRVDAQGFQFAGDRRSVRELAVLEALRGTISRINDAGRYK